LPVPQWAATPLSSSGFVPQFAAPVHAAPGVGSVGTCGFRIQNFTYWMPASGPPSVTVLNVLRLAA
jgi:hypothetical protein